MKYNFDVTPNHRLNDSYRWAEKGLPEDVIGMGTADLDYYCAPCIKEALVPIAEDNCYNYRQHTRRYYDAVTGWYKRNYGLDLTDEMLTNIPSTIGAVRIALGTFTVPGDAVISQTPLFGPVQTAVEGAGCLLIRNPMKIVGDRYEIDFEDFETKVREHHPKILVLVNPNNPTGFVYKKDDLEKIVDICAENNVLIVSDEVYSLILYGDAKHTPILAASDKARDISIQIVSLSKGFNIMGMPHAIVAIANPEHRKKWKAQVAAHSFGYAVNSFAIEAVTTIMEGKADEWKEELTAYLEKNLNDIYDFIRENDLPLTPFRPEAGFLIWLDCRKAGIGTRNLDRYFMEHAHILLDDGADNFGPEGEGFVRINYAVTNKVLHEALERIKAALSR